MTSEFAVRFRAPSGEALAILKMCGLVQVTLAAPAPLLALTRPFCDIWSRMHSSMRHGVGPDHVNGGDF